MEDSFKLVAITPEDNFLNEIKYITKILDSGFAYVHIRKPKMSAEELKDFINQIPKAYHPRLKLNDHLELVESFNLSGIHINSRTCNYPQNGQFKLSKSTHSFEELNNIAKYEYVFLSPIFDSISKNGYMSHFDNASLLNARKKGLINEKVFALGGVDVTKIQYLRGIGFGGAAFLGYLFNASNEIELGKRIKAIINQIH